MILINGNGNSKGQDYLGIDFLKSPYTITHKIPISSNLEINKNHPDKLIIKDLKEHETENKNYKLSNLMTYIKEFKSSLSKKKVRLYFDK